MNKIKMMSMLSTVVAVVFIYAGVSFADTITGLSVDANGNVGIGTATPKSRLEVTGTLGISTYLFPNGAANGNYLGLGMNLYLEGTNFKTNPLAGYGYNFNGGTAIFGGPAGSLDFFVVPDDDSVPAGARSFPAADLNNYKILNLSSWGAEITRSLALVNGNATNTGDITIFFNDANATTDGKIKYNFDQNAMSFFTKDASGIHEQMRITTQGRVGIGYTNPQYELDVDGTIRGSHYELSDENLKTNVETLQNSLAKLQNIRGVNYLWKDTTKGEGLQLGLIAQEVETVFPEAVSTDSLGIKSIAYSKLVAPLIEAVKALKSENDSLTNRVKDLENRIAVLEK